MRLVLLGGPGSGKGTQAKRLSQTLNIAMVSTGNILREAIDKKTELGLKAQAYVEKGELLPNEIMIQFMTNFLLENESKNGWILEGYPRTSFQAEELDFLLEKINQSLNYAIYLEVNNTVMKQRSLTRSLMDDQPEIIERRIELFKQQTIPILEYYEGTKRLLTISGEPSSEVVEKTILSAL
ncbi:adenylate kinase family protein [Aphanothece sacrum]|uniref:Adenylate kinase n=1 Tax=Aphanothece sacrum FPU1 TaxID=1920663 RepID=A0A401INP2_APHSA|nr:nucleoside monophosphate kinase [Aphanothece sacrum]GBF82861.1 adenylate kinase [Aphanothece sacrum FPU1]GBF86262.1 adenylate kinase [Aphanothece sacrum FPU3]